MEELKLPAITQSVPVFLEFLRSSAAKAGFDSRAIGELELACEEILINIAQYAYESEKGEILARFFTQENKSVRVEIIDSGALFNLLETPEPDLSKPLNQRPLGGLGIHLAKKLTDEITYSRDQNKNKITIIKYRTISK